MTKLKSRRGVYDEKTPNAQIPKYLFPAPPAPRAVGRCPSRVPGAMLLLAEAC